MNEKNHQLHHPLLPKTTILHTTTTTTPTTTSPSPSNSTNHKLDIGILPRLVFLLFIGVISLLANHESSKGFNITILNEAGTNTIAAKRFDLFYISNDEISRLILRASQFVENILYPDGIYLKKQVNHVIVTLSRRNLMSSLESNGKNTNMVVVNSLKEHNFVIEISPLVMERDDFKEAMFLAVHQGMVRVWLLNGDGNVPPNLVNGIVNYMSNSAVPSRKLSPDKITRLSGEILWEGMNEDDVAMYLGYCEMHVEGFVRSLNQEMKDGWRDQILPKTCKSSSHLINTTTSDTKSSF